MSDDLDRELPDDPDEWTRDDWIDLLAVMGRKACEQGKRLEIVGNPGDPDCLYGLVDEEGTS